MLVGTLKKGLERWRGSAPIPCQPILHYTLRPRISTPEFVEMLESPANPHVLEIRLSLIGGMLVVWCLRGLIFVTTPAFVLGSRLSLF